MGLIVDEKYEEGYRELNKGNQLWRDGGGLILFDLVHFMMAQALRFLGDTQRAISLIEEAIALVDRTGHAMHEPEVHRVRGELLLLGGSPNLAIATASFQKAIEVAQSNEARSWELRAATSLARLWQSENRSHEAYDLLAPVYDWFTEGFESADLRDAKALLESLR